MSWEYLCTTSVYTPLKKNPPLNLSKENFGEAGELKTYLRTPPPQPPRRLIRDQLPKPKHQSVDEG